MNTQISHVNTPTSVATRFVNSENVSRTTMSSRDMAELVGLRHDNVKRTIDSLTVKGVIGSPQIEEYLDSLRRPAKQYLVGKRDSFIVVAQLCPEFTARLVDRWQELEDMATAGITYSAINGAHAKFGDSSGLLVAQVMTGEVFHRLIGQNLANATQLFTSTSVNIVSILGRPVVVTDSPALYAAGTPNLQKVLSLADSAAIVHDGSDLITNVETGNGKNRIETTFQADYSFGLGLKGYAWDVANGGKSPTSAELATGSNWDKYLANLKATAGVITIGDAAK